MPNRRGARTWSRPGSGLEFGIGRSFDLGLGLWIGPGLARTAARRGAGAAGGVERRCSLRSRSQLGGRARISRSRSQLGGRARISRSSSQLGGRARISREARAGGASQGGRGVARGRAGTARRAIDGGHAHAARARHA